MVNLTNVKNVPVVVKMRLHEFRNSRDVLDFNVAMSAHDAFTAIIRESDDGARPILQIIDTDTCVVPVSLMEGARSAALSPYGFSGPTLDQDDDEQDNSDWSETDVIGGDASAAAAYDRMREGYIEFIVMGYAEGDKDGELTGSNGLSGADEKTVTLVGNAIEQHACAEVDAAFRVANILDTARQFGEPINALKFNFRFLNPERGVEAGGDAVTWASFFNDHDVDDDSDWEPVLDEFGLEDNTVSPADNAHCTIDRGATRRDSATPWDPTDALYHMTGDASGNSLSCFNLITAQEPFDFLEPSLNDAYPPVGWYVDHDLNDDWGVLGYDSLGPVGYRGVDAVSATIQRTAVINEWALNTETGSESTWVVTFPTKTFYVDSGLGRQFGIIEQDRPDAVVDMSLPSLSRSVAKGAQAMSAPYPPFAEEFIDDDNGQSCVKVEFTRFDRAENSPEAPDNGGTVISPAPAGVAPADYLCYEANVITFSKDGADNEGPFNTPNAVTVDMGGLDANNGWMLLNLMPAGTPAADYGLIDTYYYEGLLGLPAVGFLLKQRDLGDPTMNYASSMTHSFYRDYKEYPSSGRMSSRSASSEKKSRRHR